MKGQMGGLGGQQQEAHSCRQRARPGGQWSTEIGGLVPQNPFCFTALLASLKRALGIKLPLVIKFARSNCISFCD